MAGTLTTNAGIDQLEADMAKLPQVVFPVFHRFAPGLYMREIHIPAGHIWTTATHKKDHFYLMLKGKTRMASSTEGDVIHEAPCSGVTLAGTRRVVTSEEDVIWVTVHPNPNNITDIEKLSGELVTHENPMIQDSNFIPQFLQNPSLIR